MSAAVVAQWAAIGIGLLGAGAAWLRAGQANKRADDANELSEQANTVAQAGYERLSEDHYVRWAGEWVEPGVYRLFNRGDHTAYAVSLDISVGQRSGRMTEEAVHKDAHIDIDARPEALAVIRELAERAQQKQAREQRAASERLRPIGYQGFEPPRMPSGHLHYDITWKSELGQRHKDAHTSRFSDYGVE